eukprot:1097100_1
MQGLVHNVAKLALDEAGCVQYYPLRKCTKCTKIYATSTSTQVLKKHHNKNHTVTAPAASQANPQSQSQSQNTMDQYTVMQTRLDQMVRKATMSWMIRKHQMMKQ